jgi:hypothetical protein
MEGMLELSSATPTEPLTACSLEATSAKALASETAQTLDDKWESSRAMGSEALELELWERG